MQQNTTCNTWYVGIDETGKFHHLDPNDNSKVCAVVTQKKPEEIFHIFEKQCKQPKESFSKQKYRERILERFHGSEQGKKKFQILDNLLKKSDAELIKYIVQSEGKPGIVVNPQQWWLSAVLCVIQKVFSLIAYKQGDTIHIHIASRAIKTLGLTTPTNSDTYNKDLAKQIQNALCKKYRNRNKDLIKVRLYSASSYPLPALADQACNIAKSDYQNHYSELFGNKNTFPIITLPLSNAINEDYRTLLENGDFIGATRSLLNDIFSGDYQNIEVLNNIIKSDKHSYHLQIWDIIIFSCKEKIREWSQNGKSVFHVKNLLEKLNPPEESHSDGYIRKRFLVLQADCIRSTGGISTGFFDKAEKIVETSGTYFNSPLDHWKYHVHMFCAKAEILFNSYHFGQIQTDCDNLLETQEALKAIKFPFQTSYNDTDVTLAKIYSTKGQDLAYAGKYADAQQPLETSYKLAPSNKKATYAGFLCVAYIRQNDFNNALKWATQHFKDSSNKRDLWLVLSQLRVRALGLSLQKNIDDLPKIPENLHDGGNYPWPLVLKWKAYLVLKENNSVSKAWSYLDSAYKKLTLESCEFAVRALALPVVAMQIHITKYYSEYSTQSDNILDRYNKLLNDCKDKCSSFKDFVEQNDLLRNPQKIESMWDAANLLPFHYS